MFYSIVIEWHSSVLLAKKRITVICVSSLFSFSDWSRNSNEIFVYPLNKQSVLASVSTCLITEKVVAWKVRVSRMGREVVPYTNVALSLQCDLLWQSTSEEKIFLFLLPSSSSSSPSFRSADTANPDLFCWLAIICWNFLRRNRWYFLPLVLVAFTTLEEAFGFNSTQSSSTCSTTDSTLEKCQYECPSSIEASSTCPNGNESLTSVNRRAFFINHSWPSPCRPWTSYVASVIKYIHTCWILNLPMLSNHNYEHWPLNKCRQKSSRRRWDLDWKACLGDRSDQRT